MFVLSSTVRANTLVLIKPISITTRLTCTLIYYCTLFLALTPTYSTTTPVSAMLVLWFTSFPFILTFQIKLLLTFSLTNNLMALTLLFLLPLRLLAYLNILTTYVLYCPTYFNYTLTYTTLLPIVVTTGSLAFLL